MLSVTDFVLLYKMIRPLVFDQEERNPVEALIPMDFARCETYSKLSRAETSDGSDC